MQSRANRSHLPMPLSYQPFANLPDVERPAEVSPMNVTDTERVASGLLGAVLAALGVSRTGIARWVLLFAGGAFVKRALTGKCALYRKMDIDRRHERPGVPGNRGTRIEASVEIQCPAPELFRYWRKLEQLPKVMRHVKSVEEWGGICSHWRVAGPAGRVLEWDAEIINEEKDRLIAWQTMPGATVSSAGSVRFEPEANGNTRIKVAFEFDPPAGVVGVAVAGLLGTSAEIELREDLATFKDFAERELNPSGQRAGSSH